MTGVYLIHFSPPYKHARHYLGWSRNVHVRFLLHCLGGGARLTQVAVGAGCRLQLVRIWEGGDRDLERKLKNQKHSPSLCPICNGSLDFTLDDIKELEF